MRTTINIDDDVLARVRQVAERRDESLGAAVSALLREALAPRAAQADSTGLPTMPIQPGAGRADLAIVNALRDELP
ncbi:MAG: hypothetical protein MUE46_00100 [Xanthomonadales bacterium]|jgi:L-alanine-DL-glutamate epimerase-like enolase superfamily enzyme|nr:hypothetical protein [Xanthomonadales bacterium]